MDFLRQQVKLDVFVEGGTFSGGTARKMSRHFPLVYTIENSHRMHKIARENIIEKNVILLKGDTRDYLPEILDKTDNILFWLDAHWSGGETYGNNDECPLLEELEIIFRHDKNIIILIDDARLFLAPPPLPHDRNSWPSLVDIVNLLPERSDILVYEDVIYIYPRTLKKELTMHFQQLVTAEWQKTSSPKSSPFRKFLNYFSERGTK